MSKDYDVIVIGAGNGGLVSAATTAKSGLKTLVLEQHNLPGGSASSFVRGRFEFDPSLHEIAGIGSKEKPGNIRKMLDSLGVDVDWVEIPDAYRYITTEGKPFDITMPTGIEAFIEKMEQYVPGSRPKMEQYIELCREGYEAVRYISSKNADPEVLRRDYPNFLKLSTLSANEGFKAMEMPEDCKRNLETYWSYLGVNLDHMSFIQYNLMILLYVEDGAHIPKRRSHELAAGLEKSILDNGGEIWYNTMAEKMIVKDGKVVGVTTPRGDIYAKQVISSCSPHIVYNKMMDKKDVPDYEIRLTNAHHYDIMGCIIYVGLNRSNKELGLNDYAYFIGPTTDSVQLFKDMSSVDTNNFQICLCLNAANPGCSPEGTSMLAITCLFTENSWDSVTPETYVPFKNKFAKKVLENLEKVTGANILEHIEEIEIATPVTFARYLRTPKGTIFGYLSDTWDGLIPRALTLKEDTTRIPGLRFTGGHGFQGIGYNSSMLTGRTIANMAINDIKGGK